MNPIVVMIADVLAKEPPKVVFIECDHMIEELTAATADPAFRDPVLPRRLHAGALRRQPCGFEKLNHVGIEFRVVVENESSALAKSEPRLLAKSDPPVVI